MKRLICLLACILLAAASARAVESCSWYEVFVRSYQDSDGDGLGDIAGLTARLGYLQDMGYNGLWLMPVMPSPSYHKYDVTDYMAIDPEYGTEEDFRAFISAAHEKGFQVIVDLPVNHTSTQHPWFRAACAALSAGEESPYTAYYNFRREAGDGYVPLGETCWYYEERFAGGGMPDLNLANEAVREEIRAILAWWLKEMDVDGFRLDAVTSYYTGDTAQNVAFLAWLKQACEELKPGSYLVGECWAGLSVIAEYYRSGVDSFFLFPASQAEGFIAQSLRGRSGRAAKFAKALQNVLDAIPEGTLAPFLSNHDTGRTIGSVQGRSNPAAAKFAEGVLNMLPGCVFTYYGEEIGMVGSGDDPNKRLAMYWSDADMTLQPPGVTNLEYAYPSVEAQQGDPASLLNYCRAVNRLRLSCPAIARGENTLLSTEGELLLMRRQTDEQTVLIAVNFSPKEAQTAELATSVTLIGQVNVAEEEATLAGQTLTVPAYGIVVMGE